MSSSVLVWHCRIQMPIATRSCTRCVRCPGGPGTAIGVTTRTREPRRNRDMHCLLLVSLVGSDNVVWYARQEAGYPKILSSSHAVAVEVGLATTHGACAIRLAGAERSVCARPGIRGRSRRDLRERSRR